VNLTMHFSLRKFLVCSNKFIYLGISLFTLEIRNRDFLVSVLRFALYSIAFNMAKVAVYILFWPSTDYFKGIMIIVKRIHCVILVLGAIPLIIIVLLTHYLWP
jgi:hypothetical protein